jgi:hypothetical protein
MILTLTDGEYYFTRYEKRIVDHFGPFVLPRPVVRLGEPIKDGDSEAFGLKLQISGNRWRIVQNNAVNFEGDWYVDSTTGEKAMVYADTIIMSVNAFGLGESISGELILLRYVPGTIKGGPRTGFSPQWVG